MPEFIIRSGKYSGKKLQLNGAQVLMGRDDGCQIRITSQDVSRQHCLVQLSQSGWVVKDLGSQNGTFLNDVQLDSERILATGDRLRVGPMVLEFSDGTVQSKRKEPPKGGNASAKATDDEIVNWLSDSQILSAIGDTTVVKSRSTGTESALENDTATSDVPVALREPERKFASVAEEAADIIRRHYESLQDEAQGA